MARLINEATRMNVISMYKSGHAYAEIIKACNVSSYSIWKILHDENIIPMYRRHAPSTKKAGKPAQTANGENDDYELRRKKVIELFNQDKNEIEICKLTGLNLGRVRSIILQETEPAHVADFEKPVQIEAKEPEKSVAFEDAIETQLVSLHDHFFRQKNYKAAIKLAEVLDVLAKS